MQTNTPEQTTGGSVLSRLRSYKRFHILVFDALVSTLSSLIAVLTVRWLGDPFGSLKHFVYIWTLCGFLSSIIGFVLMGTHRIVLLHSSYRSIGRLISATAIKEAILAVLVLTRGLRLSVMDVELLVLLFDLLFSVGLLVFVRVIIISIHDVIISSPEANVDKLFVLAYGTSNKSVAMVTRFKTSSHYNVVGYISPDKTMEGLKFQSTAVHTFESAEDVLKLKHQLGIDGVIFARDDDFWAEQNGLVKYCLGLGIRVMISPEISSVEDIPAEAGNGNADSAAAPALHSGNGFSASQPSAAPGSYDDELGAISSKEIDFIPDGMTSLERGVKRVFSLLISTLCLIGFSPLFLIVWIAIKLEDGGPAIYKQERIGRFGRPFNIYKFRSMRVDAEAAGPALYAGDDDPRLTKVGKFIREHHLDELPQLWNVFLGDMAFVGPRPERKFYIDQIMEKDPRYEYLYQIRPGVTSYATYYNGYTDTLEKMLRRLRYDLYYLKHRSWWFDAKVLWMTFRSIAFGKKF